jgi:hypothetical protein
LLFRIVVYLLIDHALGIAISHHIQNHLTIGCERHSSFVIFFCWLAEGAGVSNIGCSTPLDGADVEDYGITLLQSTAAWPIVSTEMSLFGIEEISGSTRKRRKVQKPSTVTEPNEAVMEEVRNATRTQPVLKLHGRLLLGDPFVQFGSDRDGRIEGKTLSCLERCEFFICKQFAGQGPVPPVAASIWISSSIFELGAAVKYKT